jgi:hypothetical protein
LDTIHTLPSKNPGFYLCLRQTHAAKQLWGEGFP